MLLYTEYLWCCRWPYLSNCFLCNLHPCLPHSNDYGPYPFLGQTKPSSSLFFSPCSFFGLAKLVTLSSRRSPDFLVSASNLLPKRDLFQSLWLKQVSTPIQTISCASNQLSLADRTYLLTQLSSLI